MPAFCAMCEMQAPVCATHLETPIAPMTVNDWGSLTFASYRFYKAFLVANHIAS
jgi:hypothetical protein